MSIASASAATSTAVETSSRQIVHRTTGHRQGPIARLMSPGDLGQKLKPFVFLDLFSSDSSFVGGMALHPHSGIATVTVATEGNFHFDDPASGVGTLGYGGVEWMRAGGGVWHGKEMSQGSSPRIVGFQLWLALPPELENGPVDSQYLEAAAMPTRGPATVILGSYEGAISPVRAPAGINYLMVTLKANQAWSYAPPAPHTVAWLAVSHGELIGANAARAGQMAIFNEQGQADLVAGKDGAVFVIASAVAHPHELVTGYYSVHTNAEALAEGEARIDALKAKLPAQTKNGRTAVFRG